MSLYAQHGWGKSDKIERAIAAGSLTGVIMSPRDETPTNLSSYAAKLRTEFGRNLKIYFDPQFYATTIPYARDGRLADYSYYKPGLSRSNFSGMSNIHKYAKDVLSFE